MIWFKRIRKMYNKIVEDICNRIDSKFENRMLYQQKQFSRPLLRIGINLVDECNLNCKGCNAFSPLAQKGEYILKKEIFEKDMRRLRELTSGELEYIHLAGGEPLLHPDLVDFLFIARKNFPETKIEIYTNGILLNQQKDSFFEACKETSTTIKCTQYPLKLNYQQIRQNCIERGVTYECEALDKSTMFKIPLDISGNQDAVYSFFHCWMANNCIQLREGKLYTCVTAANIDKVNKYFGINICRSKFDYIDIYEAKNIKEILDFLARPIPLCRYCERCTSTEYYEWETSKKNINEWT